MKVVGVADSDSYVKWGSTTLERMPAEWQRSLVVFRTPALPSNVQLGAALAGTRFTVADTAVVDLDDLAAVIATEEPDVVLLSVRGPVARVLVHQIVAAARRRPVIVSGLPGISIPETLDALYHRSQVDLFVLHSKREVRMFAELARHLGIEQEFALAALPFLAARRPEARHGTDILFAPQAKVPWLLRDRTQLLGWLVETARRHPERRVVIKLRGRVGEAQTHPERYPFDMLLAKLDEVPDNLVLSTGSMAEHLREAGALVTVSSTAALEAIALGVPVLAIDDFGVTARLINPVFEDSGLLAGSASLIDGEFREPSEHWLDDNYFHAPSDANWIDLIEAAVQRRDAGELPLRKQFRAGLGGDLRRARDRKRALGKYDRTVGGFLALAVGPLHGMARLLRAALRRSSETQEQERIRVP